MCCGRREDRRSARCPKLQPPARFPHRPSTCRELKIREISYQGRHGKAGPAGVVHMPCYAPLRDLNTSLSCFFAKSNIIILFLEIMCMCVWVYAYEYKRPQRLWDPSQSESKGDVRYPLWVLGTELRSVYRVYSIQNSEQCTR